jgi:hypothetical protein
VFSSVRCSSCGSWAFECTRGLIVVSGWTSLRLVRGEATGICRACRDDLLPREPGAWTPVSSVVIPTAPDSPSAWGDARR